VRALALVLVAAGCGSSAAGSSTASSTSTRATFATDSPSKSALMIFADEGRTELASALGVKTVQPVVGSWHRPVYSCTYAYADGSMTLSVRELATTDVAQ
jgi:hypothetical protein